MFEPGSDSRHLNAGRHAGSKRISPALIPEQRLNPGFDVVPTLSTLHRWFTRVRLSDPHLTQSRRAFSLTLTTGTLNPSRSRWFGACLRRPAPRDLPSSRTYIAWRTVAIVAGEDSQAVEFRLARPVGAVEGRVDEGAEHGGRCIWHRRGRDTQLATCAEWSATSTPCHGTLDSETGKDNVTIEGKSRTGL